MCNNNIEGSNVQSTDAAGDVMQDIVGGNYTPTKMSGSKDPNGKTEIQRAQEIIDFFRDKLPLEFGIAVAGVWSAESGIKNWNYNKAEQTNGYAFSDKYAPNADKFNYKGQTFYKDRATMTRFGYGKGLAQWSWSRNLKFRDWYRAGADGNTTPGVTMDDNASAITATSVTTQTAFAWKEMQERTGEFMGVVNYIKDHPAQRGTKEFENNIVLAVDAVLRGFENGGVKKMATKKFMDNYKWDGGYKGAMKKRVERALGIYKELYS